MVILQKRVAALSQASLERFVLRARRAAGLRGTIDVLVASSAALHTLNRKFRGKDRATDVLSFPSPDALSTNNQGKAIHAGDIAISAEIAAQNATRLGHSAAEEVKLLVLHGILHLAGFDHERDNGQMALKEMKLRRELGLPVALLQRSQIAPRQSSKRGPGHPRSGAGRGTK